MTDREKVDLYSQMKAACDQIGVKLLSDDTCCRLLAAVYMYGDESAVYSEIMRRDIAEAQARAGILPGYEPNPVMVEMTARYAGRLERGDTSLLKPISERYHVTFPALSDWRADAREHWKEYIGRGKESIT